MSDALVVASWWLIIQVLGLAAWPLAFRLLRWLPDRGYTLAKPLGLLLVSYVLWLLASLRILPNTLPGILIAFLIVIIPEAESAPHTAPALPTAPQEAPNQQEPYPSYQ